MKRRTFVGVFGFGFFLFLFEAATGGLECHFELPETAGISLREAIYTLFLKTRFLYGYIFRAGYSYDLHRPVLNAFLAS
jgi:hypothetical protein